MKLLLNLLVGIVLLFGCATTPPSTDKLDAAYENYINTQKLEELKQIRVFKFHGWREVDKKHLIISTSFKRLFFITLKSRCVNLSFTYSIGINQTGSSLHAGFDSIYVPGFAGQKCFIESIHKINRQQADEITQLKKEVADTADS